MKPSLCLLITALFLVSCDQQEVDASRLVIRNETAYEVNSNTPFTGIALTYHENGRVYDRITYKDGNMDGIQEEYLENGTLSYRVNHKDGNTNGTIELYFENGQLQARGNLKDGVADGITESYFEDGTLAYRGNYKDGELLGRCFESGCTDFSL